jgi:hypothetical protein
MIQLAFRGLLDATRGWLRSLGCIHLTSPFCLPSPLLSLFTIGNYVQFHLPDDNQGNQMAVGWFSPYKRTAIDSKNNFSRTQRRLVYDGPRVGVDV